jgi:hypothetical protein
MFAIRRHAAIMRNIKFSFFFRYLGRWSGDFWWLVATKTPDDCHSTTLAGP